VIIWRQPLDPFRSDFFVAYHHGKSAAWVAKVREVKLVNAQERAGEIHRPLADMKAAYDYRFQLEKGVKKGVKKRGQALPIDITAVG